MFQNQGNEIKTKASENATVLGSLMQSTYLKIITYIKALQQQNRSLLSQAAWSKTGIAN